MAGTAKAKRNSPSESGLSADQKVFKRYTDKALDLTRRNRLLKYPNSAPRLEFNVPLDECENHFGSPSEFSLSFPHKKILDAEARKLKKKLRGEELDEDDDDGTRAILEGERLLNQITKLQRLASKTFKDHGLSTLFVAVGEIDWKIVPQGRSSAQAVDENAKDQVFVAPVMLIPVSLATPRSQPKTSTIEVDLSLYPIQINPVLLTWMAQNQLPVPDISESMAEDYTQISKLLKKMKDAFQEGLITANVSERVYVGQFTYHGQQVHEDLKRNEAAMLAHDFISGICGVINTSDAESEASNPIDASEDDRTTDDFFTVEDDFTIHDSDSSQTDAIRAVLSGKHMVIHGPPGTGKSQTIANIIANLIAREKKVLFVCEKTAALDVVYRQKMAFDQVNLADLCLPLYDYKGSRATFAKDLLASRDRVLANLDIYGEGKYDEVLRKRSLRLDVIKDYSETVIETLTPFGRSPYWVFGELANISDRAKDLRVEWVGKPVDEFEHVDLEIHTTVLAELNPYKEALSTAVSHKWTLVMRKHSTSGAGRLILKALKEFRAHVLRHSTISGTRLEPNTIAGAEEVVEIIANPQNKTVLDRNVYSAHPFSAHDLVDARALVTTCSSAAEAYRGILAILGITEIRSGNDQKEITLEMPSTLSDDADLVVLFSSPVKGALERIEQLLSAVPRKMPRLLSGITLQQYRKNAGLYRIDKRLVKMITMSSDNIVVAQKSLKTLDTLSSQIEKSEQVLSRYGVHIKDLVVADVSSIEERFATGYRTFFRYFSNAYKSDKYKIEQWCVSEKPVGYRALKEVAECAASLQRAKRRLEDEKVLLMEQCSLTDANVSIGDIRYVMEMMQAFLELNSAVKVDESVFEIASSDECRDVSTDIAAISEQLLPHWSVLHQFASKDLSALQISDAVAFVKEFSAQYETVQKTLNLVHNHMDTSPVSYTLVQLRDDTNLLNEALSKRKRLEDSSIAQLTGVSIDKVLVDETVIRDLSAHLDALETLRPFFSGRSTLRQLYGYCDALSENLAAVQLWHTECDAILKNIAALYENDDAIKAHKAMSFSALNKFISEIEDDSAGLEEWMRFKHHLNSATEHGLAWFLGVLSSVKLDATPIEEIYRASFYTEFLEKASEARPALKDFSIEKHQKLLNEFKKLDKDALRANRMRILGVLQDDIASGKRYGFMAEKVLRREAEKTKMHKPIRELIDQYSNHIQRMKPCWMVSPLTLGSFMRYGSVEFDVVIFDEASQMTVENALGAIARAKQVVVIGDEHQVPPTPFFNFASADDEEEDEEIMASSGFESILRGAISIVGDSKTWLKYHYRSKSEDLIAFSNHYIYSHFNQPLVTFPSAMSGRRGVELVHVNGVYKSTERRTNIIEAEAIAEMCVAHAKKTPDKSLGVIAFSVAQEEEIRDALLRRLKDDPDVQSILDENSDDGHSGFFVTNLESVQGDERDVIILSVCYGKDPTGSFPQRFGPLNSQYGYRRLNVAVTRAKEKVFCVASIHAHDIKIAEKTSLGVQLLQKYLEYARDGIKTLSASKMVQSDEMREPDSDFEVAVKEALERRGHIVDVQVGASGYKIDLAIIDPKSKNHYILGIECDGAAYHSSSSARERDRIRQDVLENYGWTIYRIWSQHWFEHRDDVLDDIDHHIKKLSETTV